MPAILGIRAVRRKGRKRVKPSRPKRRGAKISELRREQASENRKPRRAWLPFLAGIAAAALTIWLVLGAKGIRFSDIWSQAGENKLDPLNALEETLSPTERAAIQPSRAAARGHAQAGRSDQAPQPTA